MSNFKIKQFSFVAYFQDNRPMFVQSLMNRKIDALQKKIEKQVRTSGDEIQKWTSKTLPNCSSRRFSSRCRFRFFLSWWPIVPPGSLTTSSFPRLTIRLSGSKPSQMLSEKVESFIVFPYLVGYKWQYLLFTFI